MKYFRLRPHPSYTDAPHLKKWDHLFKTKAYLQKEFWAIPENMTWTVHANPYMQFPEFIPYPFPLLSIKAWSILKQFHSDIRYRNVILLDRENQIPAPYRLPLLDSFDCIHKDTIYGNTKNEIKTLYIKESKIENRALFFASPLETPLLIGRLDFVEALLQKNMTGFMAEPILLGRNE